MTVQELQQEASDLLAWLKWCGRKHCETCGRDGQYAWRRRENGLLQAVLLCDVCVPKCEYKDCGNVCLLGTEGNCAEHEEMENAAFTEALKAAESAELCEMRATEVA